MNLDWIGLEVVDAKCFATCHGRAERWSRDGRLFLRPISVSSADPEERPIPADSPTQTQARLEIKIFSSPTRDSPFHHRGV